MTVMSKKERRHALTSTLWHPLPVRLSLHAEGVGGGVERGEGERGKKEKKKKRENPAYCTQQTFHLKLDMTR